jgi:hypothetical protein
MSGALRGALGLPGKTKRAVGKTARLDFGLSLIWKNDRSSLFIGIDRCLGLPARITTGI